MAAIAPSTVISGLPRRLVQDGIVDEETMIEVLEKTRNIGGTVVAHLIHEELAEIDEARTAGDLAQIAEEVGDLLLAVTNLARHLKVNPEQALRNANRKFITRFETLESSLNEAGEEWGDLDLEQLEARWQSLKAKSD